ncbi:MAG: SDR family NAD(P)-dependent oxidoreductase [Fimbriimonadales bacterium]
MISNLLDLTDKHIFIAGGSRGIGAAAARMAAEAGAPVSLSYRDNHEAAMKLVKEIEAKSGRALAVQVELADEQSVDNAVDEAVRQLGPLNGMVVSAGIFEGCFLEDMTVEFWDRTMAINVRGTFLAVRAAARHMRAAGKGGSIVIYTSTAGQRGSAEYSAYATSKGAQIMFMRSMAKELAPDRIRVNCIAPAWTETDLAAPSLDSLGRESVAAGFPLGRIGLPEDVAGATCFLLSDLSGFITGSTITVDGGMDMRG